MNILISGAVLAAAITFVAPALAQDSTPGTSVQTGAAASSSMKSNGVMNNDASSGSISSNTTMHHAKAKRHASTAMDSSSANGVVNSDSQMPGHKTTGN